MATVTYSNKVSGPKAQNAFVKLLNQKYPNARRMERIPWWASILSIQSITTLILKMDQTGIPHVGM